MKMFISHCLCDDQYLIILTRTYCGLFISFHIKHACWHDIPTGVGIEIPIFKIWAMGPHLKRMGNGSPSLIMRAWVDTDRCNTPLYQYVQNRRCGMSMICIALHSWEMNCMFYNENILLMKWCLCVAIVTCTCWVLDSRLLFMFSFRYFLRKRHAWEWDRIFDALHITFTMTNKSPLLFNWIILIIDCYLVVVSILHGGMFPL